MTKSTKININKADIAVEEIFEWWDSYCWMILK